MLGLIGVEVCRDLYFVGERRKKMEVVKEVR